MAGYFLNYLLCCPCQLFSLELWGVPHSMIFFILYKRKEVMYTKCYEDMARERNYIM
jgi:hypothetical protein